MTVSWCSFTVACFLFLSSFRVERKFACCIAPWTIRPVAGVGGFLVGAFRLGGIHHVSRMDYTTVLVSSPTHWNGWFGMVRLRKCIFFFFLSLFSLVVEEDHFHVSDRSFFDVVSHALVPRTSLFRFVLGWLVPSVSYGGARGSSWMRRGSLITTRRPPALAMVGITRHPFFPHRRRCSTHLTGRIPPKQPGKKDPPFKPQPVLHPSEKRAPIPSTGPGVGPRRTKDGRIRPDGKRTHPSQAKENGRRNPTCERKTNMCVRTTGQNKEGNALPWSTIAKPSIAMPWTKAMRSDPREGGGKNATSIRSFRSKDNAHTRMRTKQNPRPETICRSKGSPTSARRQATAMRMMCNELVQSEAFDVAKG